MLVRKPTADRIEAFLATQRSVSPTYTPIGLSALSPPGYATGGLRVHLGDATTYDRATDALDRWCGFAIDWVDLHPDRPTAELGTNLAILVRAFGLWSMLACRVVERFPTDADDVRYGFAYGTLPHHDETGEESFTIERDADGVWYAIRAVARPRSRTAKAMAPMLPWVRRRFWRASATAMRRAISERR